MGYRFNRQASSASSNQCQLLYGRKLIFPNFIQKKLAFVVDLDDPNIWTKCLQERAQFFYKAMPMAMKILFIAQHRDKLCYTCICSGVFRPQLQRFRQGDYVYFQYEAPTTLDVRVKCTII